VKQGIDRLVALPDDRDVLILSSEARRLTVTLVVVVASAVLGGLLTLALRLTRTASHGNGAPLRGGPLTAAFGDGARTAVTALWLVGVVLTAITAPLAAVRLGAANALPFLVAAVGLALLAVQTFRGARWALVVSLVLLGAQVAGVAGSAWELVQGPAGGKAAELRAIGFDPMLGVVVNLVYSSAAVGLFGWAVVCLGLHHRTLRRSSPAAD
jgi:hypothetical protein